MCEKNRLVEGKEEARSLNNQMIIHVLLGSEVNLRLDAQFKVAS